MIVRQLGVKEYSAVFDNMKAFNEQRDENTIDEIWLLEHEPVFTQGQAGKEEYVLMPMIFSSRMRWHAMRVGYHLTFSILVRHHLLISE